MILVNDITGLFKRTIYGHAGDQVKVIAVHGTVTIVENEKGFRFPVSDDDMRIDEANPSAISPVPAKAINKKQSVPQKTPVLALPSTDQQSLF